MLQWVRKAPFIQMSDGIPADQPWGNTLAGRGGGGAGQPAHGLPPVRVCEQPAGTVEGQEPDPLYPNFSKGTTSPADRFTQTSGKPLLFSFHVTF